MRLLFLALTLACSAVNPVAKAKAFPVKVAHAFLGDIDEDSANAAASDVEAGFKGGAKYIALHIRSFGGSVFAGLDLISRVSMARDAAGGKVICSVDGYAMSMAFVVLESSACDYRVMTSSSLLLAHNASGQLKGNAVEIEKGLDFLKAIDRTMAMLISKRLGMDYLVTYQLKVFGRDWIMTADEALAMRAVDRVVD